jgi:hypothetical protein
MLARVSGHVPKDAPSRVHLRVQRVRSSVCHSDKRSSTAMQYCGGRQDLRRIEVEEQARGRL